jgi:hypothetical protein
MKKLWLLLFVTLFCASGIVAQQNPADAPASKEDIRRYLDVMHSREMMAQIADSMMKPMHQMLHERYLKDKTKLPPDFEDRMNKMMDDEMKAFPWDEMLNAMIPVYQKHLTKSNVDAMVAFYSGPTGQKLLKELPVMMGEAMQAMMPVMQKQMESMTERVQKEVAEMTHDSGTKSDKAIQPLSN